VARRADQSPTAAGTAESAAEELVTQDEGEAPFATADGTRSAGLVTTHSLVLPGLLRLESGRSLSDVTVAYETYGWLNARRDNAIMLCHALSGDAHAAGYHTPQDRRPGWWDDMVGPGKAFDTDRYFVICSNVLGGCRGTTGPSSANPRTGQPYAMEFPVVTVGDMVAVQAGLLDALGIEELAAVAGGSMGGMQVLQWAVHHAHRVRRAIVLASCARLTAQALAFNEVGRQAIMGDPRWREGRYAPHDPPIGGLAAARMVGHLTYLSAVGMERRFGRRLQQREEISYSFSADYQVESYLRYQAASFVRRFDANSYLYITRAMDYFDLEGEFTSLAEAMSRARAEFLIVSVSTDWLYPTAQARELVDALEAGGRGAHFVEVASPHGHDAFLIESATLTPHIKRFLAQGLEGQS
jgi:homoserine O-acetyltransferase